MTEAERTRVQVEPVLLEAMDARRKLATAEKKFSALTERIMRQGGMVISYSEASKLRTERDGFAQTLRAAIEHIEATGCVVKDLDVGLLDFPSRINDEDVYLCWRVGEDRIRFYHRQHEGFAGRKPIDPRDSGRQNPIQ